ncbi:MAG: hypothetical protein ACYS8Z_27405 [Planctomycetota bacterium]
MKCLKIQALLTVAVICAAGTAQANWVTLDYPGAIGTIAHGIDGQNVVGSYQDASGNWHAFIYDGSSWTALDFPGAENTAAYGIDGDKVVGHYGEGFQSYQGFLYDGVTWTTLDFPEGTDPPPFSAPVFEHFCVRHRRRQDRRSVLARVGTARIPV